MRRSFIEERRADPRFPSARNIDASRPLQIVAMHNGVGRSAVDLVLHRCNRKDPPS
jgi:hypothetical protein